MRIREAAMAIALIAAIGVAAGAEAEPLTIRVGWVVTPGHMAPRTAIPAISARISSSLRMARSTPSET
jgi:hypothetical protein